MKPSALQQSLIATGSLAFLISLFAAMQFYSSLGETFGGKMVYVATGVLLLTVAVILLPICMKLYEDGQILATLFFALVWALLTTLAVFSEFGFFAKQQSQAEAVRSQLSESTNLARQRYETAQRREEELSKFASLAAAADMVSAKEAEIANLQEKLARCPKGHNTKCVDPTNAAINAARQEIAVAKGNVDGAALYQEAVKAREQAETALKAAANPDFGNGSAVHLHPAYQWSEKLTGIDAKTIQVFSTATIVIILELWASLAAYLLMKLYGVVHLGESPQRKPDYGYPPIPAPPPAGRLLDRLQGNPLLDKSLLDKADSTHLSDKPLLDKADSTHLSDKPLLDKADSTHLSDRRKGAKAPCIDCGTTITLKHKNHLRCDSCRVEHERTYRIKGMRHAAG